MIASGFLEKGGGSNLNNLTSLFNKEVVETKSFVNLLENKDDTPSKGGNSFRTLGKNWESNNSSNKDNSRKNPIKFQETINASVQADLKTEDSKDDGSSNVSIEEKDVVEGEERRSSRQSVDQLLEEIAAINETKRL